MRTVICMNTATRAAADTGPALHIRWDIVSAMRNMADLDADADLASAMGVDVSTVSRVMRRKSEPGTRFLAGLAIALNVPLSNLVQITDREGRPVVIDATSRRAA